jgi:NADH:ubiquinone oxidoreductase subunit F (NADH-binding)
MGVTSLLPEPDLRDGSDAGTAIALAGDGHARLLAGPASPTRETLDAHDRRLGSILDWTASPDVLRSLVREAGLVGRGGGEFPFSQKLELAVRSPGTPLVVVNASEGEPASRKDETLVRQRPHLVLDGAHVAAVATGAPEVVICLHERRTSMRSSLEEALAERRATLGAEPAFHVVTTPDRYVAGEASAIVSFLDRGVALPRRARVPSAASGARGRPTVVSNAETYAHVGLAVRLGTGFRSAGSTRTAGSTLVTIAGATSGAGTVVELLGPATIEAVLARVSGPSRPAQAVLLGGYAGTWIDGDVAWRTPLDRHALRRAGAPLGCGVVAVLEHDQCGVAETARLLDWMADETSGQCGPCVTGLPEMARVMGLLAVGRASRADVKRLRQLAVAVRGRGACGHPTGAAILLESALDAFAHEVHAHARGRSCEAYGSGLPLPPYSERDG